MAQEGESGGKPAKRNVSELVLTAVFCLQRKNGMSCKEIASYVAKKRCTTVCKIKEEVQLALRKATKHKIFSERRGLYRIEPRYEDKLRIASLKPAAQG